jgi:sensor domain CHASE-containing protein
MIAVIEWVLFCWAILVTCVISATVLALLATLWFLGWNWCAKRDARREQQEALLRRQAAQRRLNEQRIREDEAEINRLIRETR